MAEEEKDKQEFKEPNSGLKFQNPLLTIIIVLNTVLIGAVGYFQLRLHKQFSEQPDIRDLVRSEMKAQEVAADQDATGEAKKDDGILFPLQGFTANLAQGDGPRRYIRVQLVLQFSSSSNEEEFKGRRPQIRDSIISILNSKRPEELSRPEGKDYLKEEIKSAINTFLVDGSVTDVFFVSFQIR